MSRAQVRTAVSSHNVTHVSQEASAGEGLWSKATPSPSWLRDFVRDILAVYLPNPRLAKANRVQKSAGWGAQAGVV